MSASAYKKRHGGHDYDGNEESRAGRRRNVIARGIPPIRRSVWEEVEAELRAKERKGRRAA